MEKFYVRIYYLKASHYFFYAMSIFSLMFAIFFWQESITHSIIMLVSFIVYVNMSLWIAYFFYKDYAEEVKDMAVLKIYSKPYIALSSVVIVLTLILMFLAPNFSGLLYSSLFINYYYVFIIITGFILYTIKPVRRFFEFQRVRALNKGKEIAAKYSHLTDVRHYKIGSSPFIDEMLDDVWVNREYPLPGVKKIEIEICQSRINEIDARIELAREEGRGPEIAKLLKSEKERYEDFLEQTSRYYD